MTPGANRFVAFQDPLIALMHVRLIDGTGALPGYGDQRNLELLVEAGFKPEEAIQIYSHNGAVYMGRDNLIGTIAAGKQADLVVVEGDPSARIADVEKVKYVFKAGVAYDSQKLADSVRGSVGIR